MATTREKIKRPPSNLLPAGGRRWRIGMYIAAGIFILIFGCLALLRESYKTTVIPGVRLGQHSATGWTQKALQQFVSNFDDNLNSSGFTFAYQDKSVNINPTVSGSSDTDLTYQLIQIDTDATVNVAFSYGHTGNWWRDLRDILRGFISPINIEPVYALDHDQFIGALRDNFNAFDQPAKDAQPVVQSNGKITITNESSGQILDYQSAVDQAVSEIKDFNIQAITLQLETDQPKIQKSETAAAANQLSAIVNNLPWTLTANDQKWTIDAKTASRWFTFTRDDQHEVQPDFNSTVVAQYLDTVPGAVINKEAASGRFQVVDGKVTQFQTNQLGAKINDEKTIALMRQTFFTGSGNQVALTIDTVEPISSSDSASLLGIKELVAEGRTSFKGSPKNRVHNITVGAEALNGLVIKPDEEFSLVKALVPIDASSGYLPELVIKGNKTTPEYGGGLCQIGTTFFRVVLNAGLPVLERQNHSYRVSYYEPPVGMDATIYDPKPDFRFKNDYANSLLLQTRIEGTELIFEFYGTKDGRNVSMTDPVISNIVPAGPTRIIETTDLKPGEKNCTEKAHKGSDAVFTYTVQYVDGHANTQEFKSHYKVWPAVCLVGAQPRSKNPVTPTNSNTNTNVNANTNGTPANNNTNTAPINTNTNISPVNTNTNTVPVNSNTNGA